VTEAAAMAAGRWTGRGDNERGDQAAVDAMRHHLANVPMRGVESRHFLVVPPRPAHAPGTPRVVLPWEAPVNSRPPRCAARGSNVRAEIAMAEADTAAFRAAREFLLANADDYDKAYAGFRWPELGEFNWALDWFDAYARDNDSPALWIVEENGDERRWSFREMAERSNRVANWLRAQGVRRGDRVILMLGNQVELWETILAAMKLGAVMIPATPLLGSADLRDRLERGRARHVVVGAANLDKFADVAGDYTRIAVGPAVAG